MRRVVTAREQAEMLEPWREAAVDPTEYGIDPDDYHFRRELGRWKPKVGDDGMVDLYHRTSPSRADSIAAHGFDPALSGDPYHRSTDEVFFTTTPHGNQGNRYGDAVVHVRVPAKDVDFDTVWGEDSEEAWATVFPPDLKGLPVRRLAAEMLAPWKTAAPNTSMVYHLTSNPNFVPDPEKTPEEGLFWSRDKSRNPKGLYVTNIPNYWLSWGNRPYVAEFEAPDELLRKFRPTRNYPEHLIPPEHFGDIKLRRVLPTPGFLREDGSNQGHFSDPEYAMGQDFLTGEKFKTRRSPNGMMLPEDRENLKSLWQKNYGDGPYVHPTDARDMTPQNRKKYERWYTRYWNTHQKEDEGY